MATPIVELENTFRNALTQGINLFVGAGFPVLANDLDGNCLPLGNELREELVREFNATHLAGMPLACIIHKPQEG